MKLQLVNLRKLGRFKNSKTGQTVSLWRGVKKDLSGHVIFYRRRFTKLIIDSDEYWNDWDRIDK